MRLSPAVACLVAGATLLVCLAQVVLRSSGTPVVKYAVPSTVSAVTPSKAVAGTIGSSEPIAAIAPLRQDAGEAEGPFECTGGASALSFGPLELNVHAKRLWGCSGADAGVRAVFLTFGSHSMADFLLNWVAHVKRLNLRLYLVGALDAKMAALCDEQGIPAATISDEHLAVMGAAKLGSHASTTYYRYAPGTFLRMGLIKQVFIRQMLLAGLDAMVSDVDVAWFRSPWPLVRYGDASQPAVRPSARLLALADVVLSVDQVQQYMDSDKHAWHIGSELNTGVAFFRNSAGALAVLDEWKEAMADAIAKGNPNHDQYWLNEVLRPRDFHNLKTDAAARAAWLPGATANIIATSTRKGGAAPVALPTSAEAFDGSEPSLRALYLFKRRFGGGRGGGHGGAGGNATVTIGTFPIAEVSNGHTFFVQKLHDIVGVPPVCVHTTYQYGDSNSYAYGKRERLRDAHLWLLDSPSTHWSGRFLHLTSMPARLHAPMKAELLQAEAVDPGHCVRSHLKLMMLQWQWLMDAFLLAKATGRILVLPPLWCMLDRFWTILNHCLIGSQVEMPQPFVCPVDHSFEIPNWVGAGLEWREHSFFTNPAAPAGMLDQAVAVRVGPGGTTGSQASQLKLPVRDGDGDGHPAGGGRSVAVAAGATFAQAVAAIKASSAASDAEVLTIDAADLGRLCRCLAGLPEVHDLAERLPRLLANSYHYCDTTDNPYFVACKKAGRPGCRKHKTYLMNVSRGVQAPPALPTTGCGHGSTCMAYQVPSQHITEGVIGATSK